MTHTQTDGPARHTHSLSPADRQLIGIARMTHAQTDGPAQHDTHRRTDLPNTAHSLSPADRWLPVLLV